MLVEAIEFISFPVIRSVAGWLQKSLEDGKIEKFELKKLFETVVRVGTIQVFAYFGFSVAGVENPILAAGIATFFADKLFGSLKENKIIKK